jgi:hypothetical protein
MEALTAAFTDLDDCTTGLIAMVWNSGQDQTIQPSQPEY